MDFFNKRRGYGRKFELKFEFFGQKNKANNNHFCNPDKKIQIKIAKSWQIYLKNEYLTDRIRN